MSRGLKPMRFPVHGEWMTMREAAEAVGISYAALRMYRSRHRDRDGRPPEQEAVIERYRAVNAGTIPQYPGRTSGRHRVKGKLVTPAEAAEALGVTRKALYCYMSYHRCGLSAAVKGIETRRARKAEREILRILKGG